jgi:hypothetical protein
MTSEILIARENVAAELRSAARRGEVERIRPGAYRRRTDDDDGGGGSGVGNARGARDGGGLLDQWERARDLHVDRARAVHGQLDGPHWFSHETAALLHGLPVWRLPRQVHLVQGYRASSRAASDLHRHVLEVPEAHRLSSQGLPLTGLARTVADCVTTLPALDGLVVADAALRRGLVLGEAVDVIEGRYRGRARGLLVLELADDGAESAWESWLRYLAHWAGLPRPQTQVPVVTRRGTFRVDMGWEELGVLAEFDGLVKYRAGAFGPGYDADEARIAEKVRHDAIVEATGVGLLRVTSRDAQDPQAVADRLLARFPADVRGRARQNPLLPRPR